MPDQMPAEQIGQMERMIADAFKSAQQQVAQQHPANVGFNGQQSVHFGQRNTPTSLTPVGPYGHGQFGLFNTPGVDPQVFSAMLLPAASVAEALPLINDADDVPDGAGQFGGLQQEFFTSITGVTQGDGEDIAKQPTAACADGARSGLLKACTLISTYGRYRHSPNAPIDLFRAGQRESRADPLTQRLMNMPADMGGFGTPGPAGVSLSNTLANELSKRFFELYTTMRRFIARRTWVGTPANNNGEFRDITGMDLHINSGNKVDAYTGQVCAALDSDIKDFGFDLVNGDGRDIVRYLEMMYDYLNWNSMRMGFGRWMGFLAMTPQAFEEIIKVVPVRAYQELLAEAGRFTNAQVNIDARTELAFRDQMKNEMFLPLRGQRVPVKWDEGIAEDDVTTNGNLIAGQYACDIYFVPTTVLGGAVPVTYWKGFDHTNRNAQTIINQMGITSTFTTDGGLFRWYVNFKNGCVDMTVDWSPRLIMRTPQLAGRIQNVAYEPLQHFRSPFPDSDYNLNGGRATGATPQNFYPPWSTDTPVRVP